MKKFAPSRIRILAFLTDVSLGYLLFNLLSDFFARIHESFGFENVFYRTGGFFILAFLVRLFSTFLLGVSFGQFFCGIRLKEGRGYRVRLAGAFRVFLELITMPLVIFELPPLWKGRTLGETLTKTRLVSAGGGLFFRFAVFPILPIVALLSPFLENFIFPDSSKDSFSYQNLNHDLNLKSVIGKGQKTPEKKMVYSSNYFRMKTHAYLEDRRFILLPSIEVTKRKKQKRIKPILTIYDTVEKKTATLAMKRTVGFLSLLKQGENGNPIFKYHYPKLYKDLMKDFSTYQRVPYENHYGKEGLLSIESRNEIDILIGDALSIASSNIWIHSITKGPFVRGYFDLRQVLVSLVGAEVDSKIGLVPLGNRKFLRFRQEYPHQNGLVLESLIPIGTHNAVVFEWSSEEGSQKSREDFINRFFARVQWYFDFKEIFPFPQDKEKLDLFHVVDYFFRANLLPERRRLLENFLIEYYSKMIATALETKNSRLQEILSADLERYQMVANIDRLETDKQFLHRVYALQTKLLIASRKTFR